MFLDRIYKIKKMSDQMALWIFYSVNSVNPVKISSPEL